MNESICSENKGMTTDIHQQQTGLGWSAEQSCNNEQRQLNNKRCYIKQKADAEFDSPMMAHKSVAQFQCNKRETVIERWLVMQKEGSEGQRRHTLQPDRHEEFICDPSGNPSDGFLVLLVAGSFALLLFLLLLETLGTDRVWLYEARPGIVVPARAI